MKLQRMLPATLIIFLLTGCSSSKPITTNIEATTSENEQEFFTSKNDKENCYLCGSNRSGMIDYYKKSGTISLLCLNTWDIADTRLYEYDDNGNLIAEPKHSGTNVDSHGENECSWMYTSNPERHTCSVSLSYGENSILNPDTLAAQLCQDCLDKVSDALWKYGYDEDWTYHCDVLMDMETEDIYPISSNITQSYIGDFWLHIDHKIENNQDMIYLVYNPN